MVSSGILFFVHQLEAEKEVKNLSLNEENTSPELREMFGELRKGSQNTSP